MTNFSSLLQIFRESYKSKNKELLDKFFTEIEKDYKSFKKEQEEIERRIEVAKKGKRYKLL
ncbi:hypothetical protein SAMN06265182_0974 [Persephonella hydrogeniphila]|uniref:Uncharacterized protein n=1 Tax=Persephonella hydrogeniphila TaxID=198703 RepID=A0A285NJ72_9AQUI|nr:hypothetical protein [Persephonella hydrogeniphila]SNZ07701.1 hypothetical protein SAMN06265182_0974 [Persephonella hydrogeniphila]